jgi:hypothetical protein
MSLDSTAQVLIAFITGVLGPILLQYVKTYLEKKSEKKDPLIQDIEYDTIVDDQINSLREELKMDRVWINQFHNGGHFNYSGKSMNKFTMFYETVSTGTSSTIGQFQNVPTSLFSKSLAEIMKVGELTIEDYENDKKPQYGLKAVAESTGCQSLYMIGLKCPTNNKMLGLLGVETVKDTHAFTPQEKARIKEIGAFLAGVITQQQGKR